MTVSSTSKLFDLKERALKSISKACQLPESEVTEEAAFWSRRKLMRAAVAATTSAMLPDVLAREGKPQQPGSPFNTTEPMTSEFSVTHYNNFYEFGVGKDEPAERAKGFKTEPWTIQVDGEAKRTGKWDVQDILKRVQQEERIYRLRCVEAWSMVVPWIGFELRQLIQWLEPTSRAKYVAFETLYDPQQMPGQKKGLWGGSTLAWPYREGLRMDEAMHPLTILATGLYGKPLPPQNGAPLRLVVPWKYGFKSIKSIVRISFLEKRPTTSWNQALPQEYGFYANVNPEVDHPRWSQKFERRIINRSLFSVRRMPTKKFNGYEQWVSHLYKGMDLSVMY